MALVIETPKSTTQHSGKILIKMAASTLEVKHFANINAPNIPNVIILETHHTLKLIFNIYLNRREP